jgi:hypothetical protein
MIKGTLRDTGFLPHSYAAPRSRPFQLIEGGWLQPADRLPYGVPADPVLLGQLVITGHALAELTSRVCGAGHPAPGPTAAARCHGPVSYGPAEVRCYQPLKRYGLPFLYWNLMLQVRA